MINNENLDKLIEFVKSMKEDEIEDLELALMEELKQANKKKESPFDVENAENAYYNSSKYVYSYDGYWDRNELYEYVPCKDKSIVEQRQKKHHLNDLLERFAYENDANVTDEMWKDEYLKYGIRRDYHNDSYYIETVITVSDLFSTYFTSEKIARMAINEVVIPFMEGSNETCD